MYRPTTRNEWWLCGVLLTQAVVTIALEIYILVSWQAWVTPTIVQVTVSMVLPINLGILIFACLYEFFLVLDAIHHKNNILLFAICISNTCTFVYSVMQYQVMEENTMRLYKDRYGYPTLVDTTRNLWPLIKPAEIIVAIATGLGSLLLWPIVYFLHKEYSWAIYKVVHGSPKTRMRYLVFEIFLVLIKLNFYFLIGFIIQYVLIYVHVYGLEYTLTMLLLPTAFFSMLLGIYFVQKEQKLGLIAIIVCYLGVIAYLISRIVVLVSANTVGKDMMFLFAFASLILTTATVICAIICMINFDRGFKSINKSKNDAAREWYYMQPTDHVPDHTRYSSRPPSRLTLD
ncbi:uncharacterized protein N7511_008632 [Penicillium nucicola]|uniref:uncharacterized protein n=1 Tax=Penicillium nucicola TaxID=1850975 RepID=UPI002544E6AD|nr:uncharacterized protein N7511_008632 [Penicillium nucicola]KAJ5746936.1 hypothetical protein N7511_008632 [Penicillium nucicola]